MDVNIVQATENDINVILLMMEKLYNELGDEKESLKFLDKNLIKEILGSGKTIILKAINSTMEPCGIISLTETQSVYAGGKYGVIDELYVTKYYRSLNVGKKLIRKAKEIGIEKGWKRIDVTAPVDNNEKALNFYKKEGFVFTGPKLKTKLKKELSIEDRLEAIS